VSEQARSRFALSFTTGALLAREGELVAEVYLDHRNWNATRAHVIDNNLLQARTSSSNLRITRETIQRLSMLSDNELELLADASPTEQRHLMWAAACRRYDFIGDFAEEVLRERFLLLSPGLNIDDFDRFLTGKTLWHPELDDLKPSTRQKLRQTLFRMLHEAGLRSPNGEIVPALLSDRVAEAMERRVPSDLRFFPTTTPFTQFNNEVQ